MAPFYNRLCFFLLFVTPSISASREDDKLDALIRRVELVEEENAKLRTEVGVLRRNQQHSTQRRQERPTVIGFSAYIAQHLSLLGQGHTILFDNTKSNFGNGYDNVTGYFVAPEAGVYVFFSNIMSEVSSGLTYIETEIVKNGNQIAEMYSGAQHAFDSASNMAVTYLKKGDHVWVRVHGAFSNNFSIHCCFSSFSGFLLGEYIMNENIAVG